MDTSYFPITPNTTQITLLFNTLTNGWLYTMYTYNAASYGDCVSAQRPPKPSRACIFGIQIVSSDNDELASTTIKLPSDIISSQYSPCYSNAIQTLPIATIIHSDNAFSDGMVIHPDYPTAEPMAVLIRSKTTQGCASHPLPPSGVVHT